MGLLQTQITTGAAAQKLAQARTGRVGLVISNHDATNAIVLGNSAVAATGGAGGIQVQAKSSLVLCDKNATIQQEEWWAVAAAGTPIVGVVEQI